MKHIRNDVVLSIIVNNKFIKYIYHSFNLNYGNRKLSNHRGIEFLL